MKEIFTETGHMKRQEYINKIASLKDQWLSLDVQSNDVVFQNYHNWFRTMMTYSSNAIEGNTLTLLEAGIVINEKTSVGGKRLVEIQETINHAACYDFVRKLANDCTLETMTLDDVLSLHKILLHDINTDYAGRWRDVPVRIAGSRVILPNHMKVDSLMQDMEKRWQTTTDHPVLVACEIHYRLVTIHPFVDGNGRTARLLSNLVLMMSGYPGMQILPEKREQYLSVLEKRQLSGEDHRETYEVFFLSQIYEFMSEVIESYG